MLDQVTSDHLMENPENYGAKGVCSEKGSFLSTHGVALREVTATLPQAWEGEVVLASAFFSPPSCVACEILVPWTGIKPVPLHWKQHGVITTGLPGKSQRLSYFSLFLKPWAEGWAQSPYSINMDVYWRLIPKWMFICIFFLCLISLQLHLKTEHSLLVLTFVCFFVRFARETGRKQFPLGLTYPASESYSPSGVSSVFVYNGVINLGELSRRSSFKPCWIMRHMSTLDGFFFF